MESDDPVTEGFRLHRAGRLDEARVVYEKILSREPSHVEASRLLGLLHLFQGNFAAAIPLLNQAAIRLPLAIEVRNDLGTALAGAGRWTDAIAAFQQALVRAPSHFAARYNLGLALTKAGRVEEAIAAFRSALAQEPNNADASCQLGGALLSVGRWREAAASSRDALKARPAFPEASYNLGVALLKEDKIEASIAAFEDALRHRPDYAAAHNGLGWACQSRNELARAITHYREALRLDPQFAQAEMHEGMAHLAAGDLGVGFRKYEARWRAEGLPMRFAERGKFWSGDVSLSGRSILLHAEQGLGDTLQFVRYAPLLAAQGATVYLEVQESLKSLLRSSRLAAGVYAKGDALPGFELHCPLPSLPLATRTELGTIPQTIPYLRAADDRLKKWRMIIGPRGDGFRIGVCWAGNPKHENDRRRSIPLEVFSGVFQRPGCRFFSLQKEIGSTAEASLPPTVTNLAAQISDFEDTAAIISGLDLVISVDTSLAHLAGALGAPTWLLLPYAPDWRWMLEREDSPWYPTVRLFRQTAMGDWRSVIHRVLTALDSLLPASQR